MNLRAITFLVMAALLGCGRPQVLPTAGAPTAAEPPEAPREFRAVWIATVANIDWPSKPGLPVAQQQVEALDIITRARTLGLNALILQVRPGADAFYESSLEPWSEFLTGTQGQAPEPRYDPLAFWIEESHRAGLELHAWFNPYRARPSAAHSASMRLTVPVTRCSLRSKKSFSTCSRSASRIFCRITCFAAWAPIRPKSTGSSATSM